ncbi:dihydrodipicolinate synthase family protein [Nonomuraea sp. K274]|uniref:Dihydrodipicolinate synthase family protein n=1 Tax=Nonomuraea cypriaca TaxID=1187855 RepID=A0A931F0C2_9ACTN|nr:dihydrodipicolinate synthase family protein [Nonomuraea cypriaca]MBF8189245.1 dihydrodipicolinate synthase family protein [Nonomuraea cypriaca]
MSVSGVIVPAVTPIDESGRPDLAAGPRYFGALAAAGITKIMLLGTNGEGPMHQTAEIGAFLGDAVGLWRTLVPDGAVVVNVSAAGTRESLRRAELAAEAGCDAVALSPPCYFHHDERDIIEHYRAGRTAAVPVIAYNIPRYAPPFSAGSIAAVADMEHVVGVKDSSGDMDILRQWLDVKRHRPHFGVNQGAEGKMLGALAEGADGLTPGIANIAPRVALELVAAHHAGDQERAVQAQERIIRLIGIHQRVRPGVPVIKATLALRGLCRAAVAPPLRTLDGAELAALREFLAGFEPELIGAAE